MDRLAGKVALMTGGARRKGEAEARLFAAEGAHMNHVLHFTDRIIAPSRARRIVSE